MGKCMSYVCHQSSRPFLELLMEPSCSFAGGHSTPGIHLTQSICTEWGWASELSRPWELASIMPLLPPGSVEVAIAVLLVTCIVVVTALLGYCFFKDQRKGLHRYRHRRQHHHPQPPTPANSTVSTTEDTEHLVYNHTTRPL